MNRLQLQFFASNFAHTWIAGSGIDEALLKEGIDLATCKTVVEVIAGIASVPVSLMADERQDDPFSLRGLAAQIKLLVPSGATVQGARHACTEVS